MKLFIFSYLFTIISVLFATNDAVAEICQKDRATIENLKLEIKALENSRRVPVRFHTEKWRGVDLNKLKGVEVEYLEQSKMHLAPNAKIDFGHCTNVPCILNTLYGAPDSINGWIMYWIYLKTGYSITASEVVPGIATVKDRTYAQSLFSTEELMVVWNALSSLPSNYYNLKSLKHIFRMSEGLIPQKDACGIYSTQHGHIVIGDQCLKVGIQPISKHAYIDHGKNGSLLITHELSHALDFSNPQNQNRNISRFSLNKEWLDLSGWKYEEWVEEKTISTPNGDYILRKTHSKFEGPSPKAEFVNDYAKTNPQEDFAETMAFLRVSPNIAFEKAPKKIEFLSRIFFNGRTYTEKGLLNYYRDYVAQRILEEPKSEMKAISELEYSEPEACELLKGPRSIVIVDLAKNRTQQLNSTPTSPSKPITEETSKPETIVNQNNNEAIEAARVKLSSKLEKLAEITRESLWTLCKKETKQPKKILFKPFTAKQQYVSIPILHCINKNIDTIAKEELKDVLGSMHKKLSPSDIELLVSETIMPALFTELMTFIKKQLADEKQWFKTNATSLKSRFSADAAKEFGPKRNTEECRDWMAKQINTIIEEDSDPALRFRFISPAEISAYFSKEVCINEN